MKKVYVLFKEQVYDFDVLTQDADIFFDKEKATKEFKEIVECEKEFAEDNEWVTEENENSFCSYNEGSYAQYHTDVWLKEKEIK